MKKVEGKGNKITRRWKLEERAEKKRGVRFVGAKSRLGNGKDLKLLEGMVYPVNTVYVEVQKGKRILDAVRSRPEVP